MFLKMNKILIISSLLFLIIWGCSSSIDVANLTPEDRMGNAKKLYEDEDYEEAVTEFEAIILQYPGSAIVDDAQYYLAMTRYQRKEYILAAYEFSKLIKNMPASSFVPDAQFMLAESYYQLSPNYNLDQTYTKKSITEYQAFIDYFPLNEKVHEAEQKINELNTKLAEKEYSIAEIYEKMDYLTASLKYYDFVVETYHDTPFGPKALYRKIMLLLEEDREDDALKDMKKYLQLFPNDENSSEIEELKNSLEEKISLN